MSRYCPTIRSIRGLASFLLVGVLFVGFGSDLAEAQVKLESICTLHGEKETRVTGMGIVVGLNGTGDGGDAGPTVRALAAAMKTLHAPVVDSAELANADNVAIVLIDATIPKEGLQKGQRLDCYVSSYLGAKSLRGGRLLVAALQSADTRSELLIGTASGSVIIEDALIPTKGRIPNGVIIESDLYQSETYISRLIRTVNNQPSIQLLLKPSHAGYISTTSVAQKINEDFGFESYDQQIAQALSPGVIRVAIPKTWQDAPVEFIAGVLSVKVNSPHTQSKVIVNTKTGVVIVSGDVEISPVLINHPNLQVAIGDPGALGGGVLTSQFVPLNDQQTGQVTGRLDELVQALNQLGVPRDAMIEVLRELAHSGKLHAIYEER